MFEFDRWLIFPRSSKKEIIAGSMQKKWKQKEQKAKFSFENGEL